MASIGNGELQFGTSGSPTSLTDYTASVKDVSFSRNGDIIDVTTFGNAARKWIKGLTDADMTVEFFYSGSLYAALQNLLTYTAGGVSFQYGPDGTTSGNPKVTQTGSLNSSTGIGLLLESVDDSTSIGEVKMLSATFKISGAITFGTYA